MTITENNFTLFFECECGNEIDIADPSDLVNSGGTLSITETVECRECKLSTRLDVDVDIDVSANIKTIEVLNPPIKDLNGNDFFFEDYNNLFTGCTIPLPDGAYEHGDFIYEVKNGMLCSFRNHTIDERQLVLF